MKGLIRIWLAAGIASLGSSCASANQYLKKGEPQIIAGQSSDVVLYSYSTDYPPSSVGNHGEEIVVIASTGELYVECMYEVGRGDCDRPKIPYAKGQGFAKAEFVQSTTYTKPIEGNIRIRYSEKGEWLCNIDDAKKEGLIKAKCGMSGWTDLSGVRPCPTGIEKYGWTDGRGGSLGESLMSLGMNRPHCICKINSKWMQANGHEERICR